MSTSDENQHGYSQPCGYEANMDAQEYLCRLCSAGWINAIDEIVCPVLLSTKSIQLCINKKNIEVIPKSIYIQIIHLFNYKKTLNYPKPLFKLPTPTFWKYLIKSNN